MKNFIKQLNQGDIIMYHAHGFISNRICSLDQTDYHHCAIYDKDGYIYESVGKGMRRILLTDSIKKSKTVLITNYRVHNLPQEKTYLLIKNIKDNYYNKTYAHSQVLFLAGVLFKKKLNLKGVLHTLSNYFFSIFGKFIECFTDKNDVHMICSELVYRTYLDTAEKENDPRFCLQIPIECNPLFSFEKNNHKLNHPCDINNLNKIKFNIQNNEKYSTDSNTEVKKKSVSVFDSLLFSDNYLRNFKYLAFFNKEQKKIFFKKKAPTVSKILKRSQLYNFITPGDIFRSFNVYPVKTYRTRFTAKYPNCNICNPTTTN